MKKFALWLALLSAVLSGTLFIQRRGRTGWALYGPRLLAGALAPFNALAGAAAALLGLIADAPLAVLLGGLSAAASARFVRRAAAPHPGFEQAFGPDWVAKIPPARRDTLPRRRWSILLPQVPAPGFQLDVVFATLPGGRGLLCDLWSPPPGVPRSGLAFIYFHGGAWYLMDKDSYTRPFFRQLTAQGHLVMDVAYRLYPETDIAGMTGDALRAVAWLKANAARLQVDPGLIVLGGGSAGGHLALLSAYALPESGLVPPELAGADLSVCGVVSLYGPPDLRPIDHHIDRSGLFRAPSPAPAGDAAPRPTPNLLRSLNPTAYRRLGVEQMQAGVSFLDLLGGPPEQAAERAEQVSPICHVRPGCPPTLLLQGQGDMLVQPARVQQLYRRLLECGVPAVYSSFPQAEHAFDLVMPQVSPAAQAALYDIQYFLAVLAAD